MGVIQSNDVPLQADMALVRNDTGPAVKINYFKATASFLIPHNPIDKKRSYSVKRCVSEISDVTGVEISSNPGNIVIGKTGVHFRLYNKNYNGKLSYEQNYELHENRKKKNPKK